MHDRPEAAAGGSLVAAPTSAAPNRIEQPLFRRSDTLGFASGFDAAWLRFTQRPLDESLYDGWLEDLHPEDRARCRSIHAEMRAPRASYSLDYRLRHGDHGYRWVMEQATPVIAADGRFDGFAHHCMDVHDRTELAERLADRLGRVRSAVRNHGAFASALAAELERLPPARVEAALKLFAALVGQPGRPQTSRRRVAEWLGRIVEAARADLQHGAVSFSFSLALPDEPIEIEFDSTTLSAALTNALVCVALRAGDGSLAGASQVRAERVDGALLLELPAWPGSSAFVLLDLALRAQGLSGGQVVSQGSAQRWRVALPVVCTGRDWPARAAA